MKIKLTSDEAALLNHQDPNTKSRGGFQARLVKLQERLAADGALDLDDEDLEWIPKYAFDYKNGGFQNRLVSIFGRSLGPKLGR